MALIKCPDCGKDISVVPVACINCGQQILPTRTHKDSENFELCAPSEFFGPACYKEAQEGLKLSPKSILLAVLVLCSVCGTGFVLWTTSTFGTGLSPDSVSYISCARNLVAGKGYTVFSGSYYKAWPPLFPTLLAALHIIGVDPLDGARFLNAGICGLIVFCSGLLFMKIIRNAYLLVLGFLIILFSGPLLYVCNYAWTEPLLVFFTVLSVLFLAQFLRHEQWSSLVLFSCCAALACLARYIGVTIVLAGCTAILVFMKQCSFLKRLKYAAVSAGIALLPITVWCIRNYSINSTLTGGRNPGDLPIIGNALLSLKILAEWFIPDILPPSLMKPTVFMNIVSGMVILLMFFRLKTANTSRPSAKNLLAAYGFIVIYLFFLFKTLALWFIPDLVPSFLVNVPFYINTALGITIITVFFWLMAGHEAQPSEKELLATYSFLIIYILFLVIAASNAKFDVINHRLLCPVYVFLVCAVLAAGDRLAALAGQKKEKYVWVVFTLLTFWFMSWPYNISLSMMWQQHNSGTIYNNIKLQQSPLLEWLRSNPLEGTMYCNAPLVLYIHTGIASYDSTRKPHDLKEFNKSFTPSKDIYLIWHTQNPEGALFTHDEIASQLPFETVKKFPDGAVLHLRN